MNILARANITTFKAMTVAIRAAVRIPDAVFSLSKIPFTVEFEFFIF